MSKTRRKTYEEEGRGPSTSYSHRKNEQVKVKRKIRKKPVFVFLLLLLFLVLLFTIEMSDTSFSSNEAVKAQVSTQETEYEGIQIKTETVENEVYEYTVKYLSTDNDADTFIEKFVQEKRDKFIEAAIAKENKDKNFIKDIFKKDTNKKVPTLNIDLSIKYVSKELLSVIIHADVVGENGKKETISLNIDRNTGEALSLQNIMVNEGSIQYLKESLERVLQKNEDQNYTQEEVTLVKEMSANEENYKVFYFTDRGFQIEFSEEVLDDSILEPFHVSIPYSLLTGIVQDSFLRSIYSDAFNGSTTVERSTQSIKPLDPNKKYIALTFDDGPNKSSTSAILDILNKHKIKATFFVLGNRVEKYPDIIKREYEEGHEIGIHTWSHPILTKLSIKEIEKEILSTSNELIKITGEAPSLVRPPYGAYNQDVKAAVNNPLVLWSVDTLDWKTKNPASILQMVKKSTCDGSIILMHDIYETTAASLEGVINYLTKQGYEFVTVSELLNLNAPGIHYAGQVYTNRDSL
ncbi:polysaccharide deacetylase family protein [Bacillus sp. N3536]|nr:polysaccharide deacetylase family protein [Bacillus sp. N3536]